MARESGYQSRLIKKIQKMLPGCFVMKTDPQLNGQGIPDLLILFKGFWGMLEVKADAKAKIQPNQPYHVHRFNEMSFASFIEPETEEQVLRDLQSALGAKRKARVSKSK